MRAYDVDLVLSFVLLFMLLVAPLPTAVAVVVIALFFWVLEGV